MDRHQERMITDFLDIFCAKIMTVAKKKTFLQMAERYNSMRVVEVK